MDNYCWAISLTTCWSPPGDLTSTVKVNACIRLLYIANVECKYSICTSLQKEKTTSASCRWWGPAFVQIRARCTPFNHCMPFCKLHWLLHWSLQWHLAGPDLAVVVVGCSGMHQHVADASHSNVCRCILVLIFCNLRWWCFSFHPLAQILHLHSCNLHCVAVAWLHVCGGDSCILLCGGGGICIYLLGESSFLHWSEYC